MTTQDDWYTFQAGNNEHGITWQHAEDLNPEEINMLLAAHVLIVIGVFALLMIIGLVCCLVTWMFGVL